MSLSDGYAEHELEVIPGQSVYAQPMKDMPQGVFLTWEHLTEAQQMKFQAAHAELAQVAVKLKDMFAEEFAKVKDTVEGCPPYPYTE
jgi:hypothetical protein